MSAAPRSGACATRYSRPSRTPGACGRSCPRWPPRGASACRSWLGEEPGWLERAADFASRVRDVTELLAEVEPVAPRRPLRMTVAYHDPCHLAHAQGVRAQPRQLLRGIPELDLREPAEWELCCGSA